MNRLWSELSRARGPIQHRFYRLRRRSQSGVALLLVITTLLFMTVIVSEMAFAATVRMQLGAHQRDEAKAEALASSGVRIYQLVLAASKAIGNNPMIQQVEQMLGLNLGDALWQMIPTLNTGLLRMLFVSGGELEADDELPSSDAPNPGELTDEEVAESRESSGSQRNFLDFDGDFSASVTDEDRKINVSVFRASNRIELLQDPTALQLHGVMTGVRTCPGPYSLLGDSEPTSRDDLDRFFLDRNIDRWSLIGNLADWTDLDNVRLYDGGSEDSLYNRLEKNPYLPKNAPFDTLEEVRLIDGWHFDDVWEKFGKNVTVYGSGKINVNTAECDVIWGLLKSYIQPMPNDDQVYRIMQAMQEQMAQTRFSDGNGFVSFVQSQGVQVDPKMRSLVGTESKVFRVTSSGKVQDATVTIEAVIDYSNSAVGQIVYWRVL